MTQANAMMQGAAGWHGCPTIGGAEGTVMMLTMGLVWLLTILILILGIAALVKYLRSDRRK